MTAMENICTSERRIVMASPDRKAWALARRRIERSRYWWGPNGRRWRWRNALFRIALSAMAVVLRVTGHYARWGRAALHPEFVELELRFAHLPPAFDGYRILHLSDSHLDILPELAATARGLMAGREVDLLVLTGDVVGASRAPISSAIRPLAEATGEVNPRDGRLAVLGNHDPSEVAEELEGIGFRVLINESVTIDQGGAHIVVTGLDDVHSFYTEAAYTALADDPGEFRIALVHSPEMADHAACAGVAFYLCGHTHGGQLCLPGGRALMTGLTRCRFAVSGLWRQGAMQGYTSRGLGTAWPPLRHNCPGEMTRITLRKGT
jgi:uncharacterized protein